MNKLNWVIKACGVLLLWAATAVALPAPRLSVLHRFCSQANCPDGANPIAGLIQGTDGNFYGTTIYGGANNSCVDSYGSGCGTIFKITPSGALTRLHSFNGTDGEYPVAGLVQGTDGKFYGTTSYGGANYNYCDSGLGNGCGTIFSITADGNLTTVYNFCSQGGGNCTDGANPLAGLIQGNDGTFYGTTLVGGTNDDGTVFNVTASGKLTTLHSFNSTDGAFPHAGLVQGTDGKFYGTTYMGGTNGYGYYGTVFSITVAGTLTMPYSFSGKDGQWPVAGLVQGTDGTFYGTTLVGGVYGNGTVFSITPSGKLTTLSSFCHYRPCGAGPHATLVLSSDGNLYGTTYGGGASDDGTVYEITPTRRLKMVHSFDGADGNQPFAGLVQGTDGKLYGTTEYGGANGPNGPCSNSPGCGTVFSLSVGLGPFVKINPTSGAVGATVTILGNSLTGSTNVTFNGTASTFTVVSASEITTTVPAGATTGTVKVVTPGGTLSSNVPFTVR
jgi:uncharacterized repeat protein (TIGR03803 family)